MNARKEGETGRRGREVCVYVRVYVTQTTSMRSVDPRSPHLQAASISDDDLRSQYSFLRRFMPGLGTTCAVAADSHRICPGTYKQQQTHARRHRKAHRKAHRHNTQTQNTGHKTQTQNTGHKTQTQTQTQTDTDTDTDRYTR